MEDLITRVGLLLLNYGVLGIAVIAMGLYILKKDREHAKERDVINGNLKEQNSRMIEAFDKNTTVLSEMKAIINTIRR
jgi:predicted HTH transcriptional regulator